jgi:hypothetical protein
MANIFARSPYIIEINETGQVETKIELRLWNGTGSAPTAPQKILSKLIPASNAPATYYDLSPYIREFIAHNTLQAQPTTVANTTNTQWCNVEIKKYKRVTTSFTQVGSTETHKAFEGFGYFEDLYNPTLSPILITASTYYYAAGADAGWITVSCGTGYSAKWTNPAGSSQTLSLTAYNNRVVDIRRVNSNYTLVGNKLEIFDSSSNLLWVGYFYPKDECKYEPVQIDFVNKFGAWQREWFFKASYDNLNVENREYNTLPSTYPNYTLTQGQRNVFNSNGKRTIRVNTDWVDESYSEIIQQMMLSEKILINKKAAKINTKSTELFKSINTKMINYQMEFEYAYDTINSVM